MTSEHEIRFVRHVFEQVNGQVTGRDVYEIFNDSPRDRFHAGVLLPREMEIASIAGAGNLPNESDSSEEFILQKVDSDSAMGLDFQIRLSKEDELVHLNLRASFDLYYPVFPTFDEARSKFNEGLTDPDAEVGENVQLEGEDPDLVRTVPDLVDNENVESIPYQIAAEVIESIGAANNGSSDVFLLPRKFRKRHVEIGPISLALNIRNLVPAQEIRNPFSEAIFAARADITNDTDLWRHLGAPEEGKREIKGVGIQDSEQQYLKAIQDLAKGELVIAPWSAYLTVTGEEALVALGDDQSNNRIFRLNISLLNSTPALSRTERERSKLEERAFFNVNFSVEAVNGTIVPFEFRGAAKDYRYNRLFDAIGSNCVAVRTGLEDEKQIIEAQSVPLYEQPWYRTRDDFPVFFEDLDDSDDANPIKSLSNLHNEMLRHLEEWDQFLTLTAPSELGQAEIEACRNDKHQFKKEVDRFELGLNALKRDERLLRAFRLMNRVFRENGANRNIRSWRLFQLAFIVVQLPALAAREQNWALEDTYSLSLKENLENVDVLWFPTGGGKTEAYLGLIAVALFYDRLRGKRCGLTAWMRFPLRMLSLQQLERLAAVVAKAEIVRSSQPDLFNPNDDPFSIGYYVGSGNTPNKIREGNIPRNSQELERQQILRLCPFCNSNARLEFDKESWRLLHRCEDEDCFSNTSEGLGSIKGSLPVFIVDNEIYRYRPSVLVGTVDKLAVLGFQKNFAHLVAPVSQRCIKHGYLSFGQCIEKSDGGPCPSKPNLFVNLPPEKDSVPSLLIQDELHLLKEELGTFNAHYEGFLDYIARKQEFLPPKILAATATIEAYETQTFHLYLKNANRFPAPSWREGESMYATSRPRHHKRRLYTGILTHHRSPDVAVLRILEIYHGLIQQLKADPRRAIDILRYENVSTEEFLDFLHLYDLSLTYVNRKATGGNIAYGLNDNVSPRLPKPIQTRLLTGDNSMTEVGKVIDRIENERRDVSGKRLDSLIATSLISHGVDLERINFMCMAGMPSKFAEYIQASSRAARNHVGLVVVCFKRSDLRERSQYHYFLPNHRYLDRLVEPVPINRFSAFAAQRTIPGIIAGLLLSYYSRDLFRRQLITKPLENMRQLKRCIEDGHITIDILKSDIEEIIGIFHPRLTQIQRDFLKREVDSVVQVNWDQIIRSIDSYLGEAIRPMRSFRDVDETIDFISDGPASAFVEKVRSFD